MGALLLGPVYFALARLLGMLLMAAVGADLPALLWAAAAAAAASSLAMLGLEGTGRAKSEYYIGYFSLQLLLVLGSLWLARRSGASLPWYGQFLTGNIPDLVIVAVFLYAACRTGGRHGGAE